MSNKFSISDQNFEIYDQLDPTKRIKFEVSGVAPNTTQTYDLSATEGGMVTEAGTQTMTNKTMIDNSFAIADNSDETKKIAFQASGISTATTRTITVGDSNFAIPEIQDNVFRVVDNGDATKKIAFEASGITTATTRTITVGDANFSIPEIQDNVFRIVDNGDSTKKISFEADAITTGNTRKITMPDYDLTLGQEGLRTISLTGAISGGLSLASCTLYKIGKVVTFIMVANSGTADTPASTLAAASASIPADSQPRADVSFPIFVFDNGTRQSGLVDFLADGSIVIYATSARGTFTGSGSTGVSDIQNFTWLTD